MQTKEELLKEIEELIAYGKEGPTINPLLLAYLEIQELEHIKQRLLEKVNTLSNEDKVWLEQFKKYK
ncbi:MAG TPA: hypothetical protein CFH81_05625 [Sulfurovum sp. UBA12169]|nr:MAG TPA: hypothetical protein CFH81_05625 [Sulfurovum sp. UBA12169]